MSATAGSMTWVGLDVHARSSACVVVDLGSGELVVHRHRGCPSGLVGWLGSLAGPARAVYEAGPTGYGLARAAAGAGLDVRVCAPGHIARHASDRVKTDLRDAERLARLYAAGELKLVRVPTEDEEAFRDLVRAREGVRRDLMRARHRISKLLLRHEIPYPGPGKAWTQRHRAWLGSLVFDDTTRGLVLEDLLVAHDHLLARRQRLEIAVNERAETSPFAETIARLRCLRGIDTLSAAGLCAEIGDFDRFPDPRKLASFVGLAPALSQSGQRTRLGGITKTGSTHARRLLVEAAQHARHQPRIGVALQRRQTGQDPRALELSWRAQRHLHARWHNLHARGKAHGVCTVAVARELTSYVWRLATLR